MHSVRTTMIVFAMFISGAAVAQTPPEAPHSEIWEDKIKKMEQVAADLGIEPKYRRSAMRQVLFPPTGTIHCS